MSVNDDKRRRLDEVIGRDCSPRSTEPAWLAGARRTQSPRTSQDEGWKQHLAAANERLARLRESEAIAAGRMDRLDKELTRILGGERLTPSRREEIRHNARERELIAHAQGVVAAEFRELDREYWALGIPVPTEEDPGVLRLLRACSARGGRTARP